MKLAPRLFAIAIALCLLPCVARADALDEAKRVAKQAGIHYQLGRFAQAADAYAHSYELVPTAGLLFNLGQCQMMLKDYEKATFFFEGYLRDKADAPNAALVRDLIAEAHREIAAKKARAEEAALARNAALARVVPPAPVVLPPPPLPPRDRRRMPAVVLGASSIALIASAAYLGQRADATHDLARLAPGTPQASGYNADHRHYLLAAGITGGVGVACAIGSGVLDYLGWRPRSVQIAVAPTANGAAAMVAGKF